MKANWNTLLLLGLFPCLGFFGKELYSEIKATHDTVLILKSQMVSHSDFDVQIYELRTRISAVEADILKLKQRE